MMWNSAKARLKKRFPLLARRFFRARDLMVGRAAIMQARRLRIGAPKLSVCYLARAFPAEPPARHGFAHGGEVKLTYLAEAFAHSFPRADILYVVSSVDHPARSEIVATAKQRGLKVVLNQNGVGHPAGDPQWEHTNARIRAVMEQADYVVYQSEFCRRSADRFVMVPEAPSLVLFNPVDTGWFRPLSDGRDRRTCTLILGGNQFNRYRFDLAVSTLRELKRHVGGVRLVVTGQLWETDPRLMDRLHADLASEGIAGSVEFTGPYTQQDAPAILARGDIMLHTVFKDPCPTVVAEALACGLPVVYLDTGGTPELVGEAGIGVPVEHSWERDTAPDPRLLAEAVKQVLKDYDAYCARARQRAVKLFRIDDYVAAHRRIFETLLQEPSQTDA